MSLVIPYVFVGGVGNKAKASEVNANFLAIANKFTEGAGGIVDGDIAASAAIKGTKLSNVLGNRIPADRYEPGSVDATALKSDANAGAPNAAVQTANHVKDGILTASKLVAASLLKGNLKLATYAYVFPAGALNNSPSFLISGASFTPVLPQGQNMLLLNIDMRRVGGPVGGFNPGRFALNLYTDSANGNVAIVGVGNGGGNPVSQDGYTILVTALLVA